MGDQLGINVKNLFAWKMSCGNFFEIPFFILSNASWTINLEQLIWEFFFLYGKLTGKRNNKNSSKNQPEYHIKIIVNTE